MPQAKTLDDQELKRLLAVIEIGRHAERNRCIVLTTFLAGMRIGEVAKLKVGDVLDPDGNVRDRIILTSAMVKGGHGRTVFVSKRLRRELQRYFLTLPRHVQRDDALFRSQKGRAFSANTLCQTVSRMYRDAGLYDCTSHSGRRTFVTKLATSGISLKVVMELVGHRNLSTTQNYISTTDQMLMNAVEIL
jgi:integrase/recombinase XerD